MKVVEFENAIESKDLLILTSRKQLNELFRVITRPKLQQYIIKRRRLVLLRLLQRWSIKVEIKQRVNACRDVKDNFILETAVNGGADYIITGDKDLLVLNPFKRIEIITFRDFKEKAF